MSDKINILLIGGNGWIGGHMTPILENNGFNVLSVSGLRADDVDAVEKALDELEPAPTRVLTLAGRTHGPGFTTIDYLEQPGKLVENVRDNLFGPIVLAQACAKRKIHFTYMGTGCIFNANEPNKAELYTEESDPDFFGSSYSIIKGFTDRLMRAMNTDTALNVRIRMPITSDMSDRNFISKITKYENICSIPNSMTVLPTLLPIMCDMIAKGRTGTINLVNPGCIAHNEILEMYKQHVDPSFTWKNFTIEEQNKILLSKRSNNVLDTTKLEAWYPDVPNIHNAVENIMKSIASVKFST